MQKKANKVNLNARKSGKIYIHVHSTLCMCMHVCNLVGPLESRKCRKIKNKTADSYDKYMNMDS